MSRWLVETVDAISDDFDYLDKRRPIEQAVRVAIKHCARQCEGEQYAAEAQLKILALLEPGDEGEGE